MRRDEYYPALLGPRPEWHTNLAAKLLLYGASLPLSTEQMNQGIADNLYMAYGLGDWLTQVREFGPACTASLENLSTGVGGAAYVFTAFNPPDLPTLPVGVTAVLPGALDRIFKLVKVIKGLPGYTEAMGLDMGIVGPEMPPPPPPENAPPPRITVTAIPGATHEVGRVKFIKDGHEYVAFQGRRGGGAWEDIGMSNKSPFIDDRDLLVAGQAEVREYRARFFDNGQPNGGWCDVAKVTVSP